MIIIEGVEMPKNCQNCPFTYEAYGDDYYFSKHTKNCVFEHDEISYDENRPEECPLREV